MLPLLALAVALQSPAQRDTIAAWRAAFAAIDDTTVLLRMERDGIARARSDRDNAMRHLELGFLAYRIGEVTGTNQHFDDGAGEFEWATELQPDWAYGWYGLGLSELAVGEAGLIAVENIRQMLGRDHLTKAARAFARAAEADPAFGDAVIELAATALRQRQRARLDVAIEALRAATATDAGRAPAVLRARGLIERQAGEADSAWAVFQRYLAAGGNPALGRLELARTAFWIQRPDTGRALYYAGAALVNDDSALAAYRQDLQWIATPEELAAFDAAAPAGLYDWLRIFWARRDAASARPVGARLGEHYRRLFYARRHYALASRHRFYNIRDRYRSEQRDVDDRGVIYIRHGEPVGRATVSGQNIEPNESWRYDVSGEPLILHFVARDDVADYRLVEHLEDVFKTGDGLFGSGGLSQGDLAQVYASRAHLDPRYAHGPSAAGSRDALARGRNALRAATTTDSWGRTFPHSLGAIVRAWLVTDSAGVARVLVGFAVPGRAMEGRAVSGGVLYPLQIELFAIPPEGVPVTFDTLRSFVAAARLADGDALSGLAELPVPAGTFNFRAVVTSGDGGAGDVLALDSLRVPHFAAGAFEVSDLVLGDAALAPRWMGLDEPVPVNPLGAWPAGGQIELYFEIHGLSAAYRARIEVRRRGGGSIFRRIGRLFGGGGTAVAVAWEGRGNGRVTRVRQAVDLRGVDPGEYRFVLRIEAPDGTRIEREVPFRVVEGAEVP